MSVARFIHYPKTRQRLFSGPLDTHIDDFAEQLFCNGYAHEMGRRKVWVVAHFNHWISDKGIDLYNIDEQTISSFISERQTDYGRPYLGDHSALIMLLNLLRKKKVAHQKKISIDNPLDVIQKEYDYFLLRKIGLQIHSVERYRPLVQEFLKKLFPKANISWRSLTVVRIRSFVSHYAKEHYPRATQLMCTALRSFFRFLLFSGYVKDDFSLAVPSVARSRLQPSLPKYLSTKQIQQVLNQCDRKTSRGKRDYAVLLLLARLGLRAKEVSSLKLQDINWLEGSISITLKGASDTKMPLLVEVGEAIADYVKNGRPVSSSRYVFLRSLAPHCEFTGSSSVSMIATAAILSSQIETPCKGSHLLRYSLATELLRSGASLAEIGQVLNHRHPDTTRLYAKVDLVSLRKIAMPWPGGVR